MPPPVLWIILSPVLGGVSNVVQQTVLNSAPSTQSAGSLLCNNGVEPVTFSADRGHHFTGDLTEQLDREECGQMELGWIVNISLLTSQLSKFYNEAWFLQSAHTHTHTHRDTANAALKQNLKLEPWTSRALRLKGGRTKVRIGCNKAVCPLLRNEM